jgi:hypothetical protein
MPAYTKLTLEEMKRLAPTAQERMKASWARGSFFYHSGAAVYAYRPALAGGFDVYRWTGRSWSLDSREERLPE